MCLQSITYIQMTSSNSITDISISQSSFPKSISAHVPSKSSIHTIEWNMLNKKKYFPLLIGSAFGHRTLLYPFSVVKTNLQIQKQSQVYSGMLDAFSKIYRNEGFFGLYKGFLISSIQLASGVLYVATYEGVRHALQNFTSINDTKVKAFIGGSCASLAVQTIMVPTDIISQHIIILGGKNNYIKQYRKPLTNVQPISLDENIFKKSRGVNRAVIQEVYKRDGLLGFYRGYFASILCYVPNSAIWWTLYHTYSNLLSSHSPERSSHLVLQTISAMMSGATTAFCTNSLDLVRARIQVERLSYPETLKKLWREEGARMFVKSYSSRCTQSVVYSFFIILGYESLKRFSIKPEFKSQVQW